MAVAAVFLDKDGTLVENVPYNVDPAQVALTSGAVEGLRRLHEAGYLLVVVTNQSGVARGYHGTSEVLAMGGYLADLLAYEGVPLAGFYFCPHLPDGIVPQFARACECRKPAPGLLLRAAEELDVDLTHSWMVGDILHDIEAGHRAGTRTVLLDNGHETEWEWSALRQPDAAAPDLSAAASIILAAESRSPTRANHPTIPKLAVLEPPEPVRV
jgi:D-glycero-D-manno-heptose 1,7-bisphosphate phosphatase